MADLAMSECCDWLLRRESTLAVLRKCRNVNRSTELVSQFSYYYALCPMSKSRGIAVWLFFVIIYFINAIFFLRYTNININVFCCYRSIQYHKCSNIHLCTTCATCFGRQLRSSSGGMYKNIKVN